MSVNNEKEYFSQALSRIREDQAKCSHPSFKCSLCCLYKDNIENDYKTIIKGLLNVISRQEAHSVSKHEITIVASDDVVV